MFGNTNGMGAKLEIPTQIKDNDNIYIHRKL